MVHQARRFESDETGDEQFWSWTLRLGFLLLAALACWAVPVILIDLLAF